MDKSFFVLARKRWILEEPPNEKARTKWNYYPLGESVEHLNKDCTVLVRFRDADQDLITDADGRIVEYKGLYYLRSKKLCMFLSTYMPERFMVAFFEGTPGNARCVVQPLDPTWIELIAEDDPTLRLHVYDVPPRDVTTITATPILSAFYRNLTDNDPELFSVHVSRFLDSPHILTPLFAHVLSIRSDHSVDFVIQLKKIAEQIRGLLKNHGKSVRLHGFQTSHLDLWAQMQGRPVAFLDGGVARIPSIARLEPLALRVGVYTVVPGETRVDEREKWFMQPYVVGDIADPKHAITEFTDRKRLLEAARYTLEPLTALYSLDQNDAAAFLLIHGPLVNQFAMYDEGEPNFIPALDPAFLEQFGITQAAVTGTVQDLPTDPKGAGPFWKHFMAVYTHVMKLIHGHPKAIAGVVERVAGRSVTKAVLSTMEKDRVINATYRKRIDEILDRYDISDDFLFGCILRSGEYITPIPVRKNLERRARDRWKPVVRQLPSPSATMLKTTDTMFPFRIEMNLAAVNQAQLLIKLIYHTARLLPRYGFPVGLDIADKYAKVPDWISRGISGEMSASVIRRAIRTGDPHVVAQVRQLLAKTPRDFFFRPGVEF
ncbi:MAG: DNA double-strand break repair nuclease NurA [Acidobacteriota bacterium]|nr:DNA double-strand break repair nuclease NurA [Acidobacteriota bacterium]